MLRWIAAALLVLLLLGVGGALWLWKSVAEDDCFIADQVDVLSVHSHAGRAYSVQRVTTGFQEKVTYIELFEGADAIDGCGEQRRSSLVAVDVDGERRDMIVEKVRVRSLYELELVASDAGLAPDASIAVDWSMTRWDAASPRHAPGARRSDAGAGSGVAQ